MPTSIAIKENKTKVTEPTRKLRKNSGLDDNHSQGLWDACPAFITDAIMVPLPYLTKSDYSTCAASLRL